MFQNTKRIDYWIMKDLRACLFQSEIIYYVSEDYSSSPISKVLPLYYHRAHAFESSRQEFPCSAQQGKRRRKKNNNNQLLLPC